MTPDSIPSNRLARRLAGGLFLAALYASSRNNYLLFHAVVEGISIVIAAGIFMLAWNARRFLESSYLLCIGISYGYVAGIDLLHTLAYKGMGVFPGSDPNLATQLWVAGRYLESVALLTAVFVATRRLNANRVASLYAAATLLLLVSILTGFFPDCFLEGSGLTPFKKFSEYFIATLLVTALAALHRQRRLFSETVFRWLSLAIALKVGSELAFTFYISVFGFSNLVGHYLRLLSFYLIYKAIIETGLISPYELLFRNLRRSEADLRAERDNLKKALDEIKTLKGILPICMICKKIRDDKGLWNRLEAYLQKHSGAEFSHGICPDCAREHYPDIDFKETDAR